ncbi:MAG TPA: sugar transferase [Chitinophagaceae bacterium]|nr:sugar transferase [Chitinophagaceae bacterium]
MYKIIKRFIDILIAGFALVMLSPILIIAIIILLLTGEHEVFYYQKRIGYKNKQFYIVKFATMLKNSVNMGTGHITLRNDPRVTWFGKILRITKINELPQIINVFKGDMSIVGPRPLMESAFKLYSEEIQNKIYYVRPGITGIGSLVFRDEEKLISASDDPVAMYATISPYKGALEMWYQKNASLYVDFMIIFLTAWSIIFPNNTLQNKVFKDLPAKEFVTSLHVPTLHVN